jgi:hypothetical protein
VDLAHCYVVSILQLCRYELPLFQPSNCFYGAIAILSPCKDRVHSHLRSTIARKISDGDAI